MLRYIKTLIYFILLILRAQFVLAVAYDSSKLILQWAKEEPVDISDDIELPQFQIVKTESKRCTNKDFSRSGK
jgi:hypothetical protein